MKRSRTKSSIYVWLVAVLVVLATVLPAGPASADINLVTLNAEGTLLNNGTQVQLSGLYNTSFAGTFKVDVTIYQSKGGQIYAANGDSGLLLGTGGQVDGWSAVTYPTYGAKFAPGWAHVLVLARTFFPGGYQMDLVRFEGDVKLHR
jgi:hypothetical protein